MSHRRIYGDYLKDMLDSAEKAISFVGEFDFDQFESDEKTNFAVLRALEIVGEAAKKVPAEFRASHTEIPWREIAGTRDKLTHEYFGVNLPVVWKTVKEDLPGLIVHLRNILADIDQVDENG